MNGRRHDANTLGEVWPKTRAMPKQWWMTNGALPVVVRACASVSHGTGAVTGFTVGYATPSCSRYDLNFVES